MAILESYHEIKSKVGRACAKSQRDPEDIVLLAVSKMQPINKIEEAYKIGVRDFGENYVQELVKKKSELSHLKDIRWHLIGPLQSNKAKLAAEFADYIHSLDSLKLAKILEKEAIRLKKIIKLFIQINIDDENSKSGISPFQLAEFFKEVSTLKNLEVIGLMIIPRPGDENHLRDVFKQTYALAEEVFQKTKAQLSMGMSEDFETAIEEGSTMIRVGRKLFGDRIK